MEWTFNDGGREAAGFLGETGDCACRAISIISGLPYTLIYHRINEIAKKERTGKRKRGKSNARKGVYRYTLHTILLSLGFDWFPTMSIGSGCTVHLKEGELPTGKLIVLCSQHLTAVIDGVIHDTFDPSREGTRCVYGFYVKVN